MEQNFFEGAALQFFGPALSPVVIAIHGFADDSTAFTPLADTALTNGFRLVVCDLPGFGISPALQCAKIDDLAAFILRLADAFSSKPVGLIAHSVGAPIAVAAAHICPDNVHAVLSIEGNLTDQDAYFSGRAVGYDDPASFKFDFCNQVAGMARENQAMNRYSDAVRSADAKSMWELGRDAASLGAANGFGHAYCNLATLNVDALYLWGRHNSPSETVRFVDENDIPNIEFARSGHWKSVDAPTETGVIAARFFATSLARH